MPEIDLRALQIKFQTDINKIANDLIAGYKLKFEQKVENLSSPLNRWLDFRLRFVDQKPRQVVFSDKFPKLDLPEKARTGLNHFVSLIEKGSDINPYQGRGLTLRNDISGEKSDARTDQLWADWNILHFHLTDGPIPDGQYFSKSSDYLAFCIVESDIVAFIDVLRHPDKQGFSNPNLIDIFHRNWPTYLEQFEVKGLKVRGEDRLTQEEIHTLRASGVNSNLIFGNKAYIPPGMGITSACTSFKVVMLADRIRRYIDDLAKMICDPKGEVQAKLNDFNINEPSFCLCITTSGLAVYEEVSSIAFFPPKRCLGEENTFFNHLYDLITPDWVVAHMKSAIQKTSL